MNGKLTTLANVKDWLGIIDTTDSDVQLSRLIMAASRFVRTYCSRDFTLMDYTDTFRGNGSSRMLLRNYPVYSISAITGVTSGNLNLLADGSTGSGYYLNTYSESQGSIELSGFSFPCGSRISVSYKAGYQTVESTMVVAGVTYTPIYEQWTLGISVSYNEILLTQVASSPATLQYALSEEGVYMWSDDDAGKIFEVQFSYVPADVQQAVIELVGERYKNKDRIGIVSKALGGQETVSFSQKDMSNAVSSYLNSYINVVPM